MVALETKLTEDLIAEGMAREVVHTIQNVRKNSGLEVSDRIKIVYGAEETLSYAMQAHRDWIMSEVLAVTMEPGAPGPGSLSPR